MRTEEWPNSFWIVDFMRFSKEGRPIEGTSWEWRGGVFNAKIALQTALSAMIDEKSPEEVSSWRCVNVRMDFQVVVAEKEAQASPLGRVETYKALQGELSLLKEREETLASTMDDLWKAMGPEEEDAVDPDGAGSRAAIRAGSKSKK